MHVRKIRWCRDQCFSNDKRIFWWHLRSESRTIPRFLTWFLVRRPCHLRCTDICLLWAIVPNIMTPVLSSFSWRKFYDIHVFMSSKQFIKLSSGLKWSGDTETYNWLSSAQLKLDWRVSKMSLFLIKVCTWLKTTFSKILAKNGRFDMGR